MDRWQVSTLVSATGHDRRRADVHALVRRRGASAVWSRSIYPADHGAFTGGCVVVRQSRADAHVGCRAGAGNVTDILVARRDLRTVRGSPSLDTGRLFG